MRSTGCDLCTHAQYEALGSSITYTSEREYQQKADHRKCDRQYQYPKWGKSSPHFVFLVLQGEYPDVVIVARHERYLMPVR